MENSKPYEKEPSSLEKEISSLVSELDKEDALRVYRLAEYLWKKKSKG